MKNTLRAGVILGGFGVLGALLVSATELQTRAVIQQNERLALLSQLHELVPQAQVDNDFLRHPLTLDAPDYLGASNTRAYLGMRHKALAAVVFEATIPNGYAGPIQMLVAVGDKGVLKGVRVVSHSETPGLGDKIELQRSDWVLSFDGKSLGNPDAARWKVKKDGGVFDQFTGATVTPRAIVESVRKVLLYYEQQHQSLLERYLRESSSDDIYAPAQNKTGELT